MGFLAQALLQCRSHLYAAADNNYVDVVGWTLKEYVTDIASYDVTLNAKFVGYLGNKVKNLFVKELRQLFICIYFHFFRYLGVQIYRKRKNWQRNAATLYS